MSARSLPVHWLCLGSTTEKLLYPPLEPMWCLCPWTSTHCMWAIPLSPQLPIFDELNSSQALLTLFTRLWGKIFCPALFFPDPKICWGYNPYPSSGRNSLGVRGSRITWILCFLHSWHKGMDLGKKPKDLSSLPVLLSQTQIAKFTSLEHAIFILVISVSIQRKGSSQLTVGNGSFQELFGTVLVYMSINQPGTVLMI